MKKLICSNTNLICYEKTYFSFRICDTRFASADKSPAGAAALAELAELAELADFSFCICDTRFASAEKSPAGAAALAELAELAELGVTVEQSRFPKMLTKSDIFICCGSMIEAFLLLDFLLRLSLLIRVVSICSPSKLYFMSRGGGEPICCHI